MAWTRIPVSEEIRENESRVVLAGSKPLIISRLEGRLYAVDAICTHKPAYLPLGVFEGACVTCPQHHAQYELTTGRMLKGPHHDQGVVIAAPDLKSYEIKMDAEGILVDL